MDALENKCPGCGASISFNPTEQMWICEYCGTRYNLEEMKKNNTAADSKSNEKVTSSKKIDIYHCKSCGAELIADDKTTATFCVYCGNTAILKNRIDEGIAPTRIIPFKLEKEKAVEEFKKLYKGRPLMPKFFNDPKNIEKLTGVYIPFWRYDLNVAGDINFDSVDVKTWGDSQYRYKKTYRYLSKRAGYMNFKGISVDASSHFDDDLMDSIEPFKYDELVEYNHAYLSGFFAEKYDIDKDKAVDRATKRAMNTAVNVIRESIHHDGVTLSSNSMEIKKTADDYILLPVWMINIKYSNKTYLFAMNGQTGKIVGNIPINRKKAIIIALSVFIISFLIIFMILGGI